MLSRPIRRRLAALAGLGFAVSNCCSCGSRIVSKPIAVVAADPGVKQTVAADTGFGLKLLRRLTKAQPTGNVFLSPISLSSALEMTLNGAGGQTEHDIAKTLGVAAMTPDQVNGANGLLLPSLCQADPKVEVSIANALWAGQGITLAPDFQERCQRFYNAHAESLDLSSPAAVSTINDWVGQNTDGRIRDLVSHEDIAGATAVLTNTVYFHGQWQTAFDKDATQELPFYLENGVTKTVPLMNRSGSFSYSETSDLQAVSLPYGDGRMSLYVLLPRSGQTVDGLMESLNAAAWGKQIAAMKPTNLDLFLPRFKADYGASLREPLSALGMASAFSRGADFGPMGLRNGMIGDVLHKAMLDVDEEGTVAAAATGTVTRSAGISLPGTTMRVDHPFFIAIRDNATDTLLFAGVIRDPE